MFDNIGGKIKILAKILCWIGIAASVVVAIIMFTSVEDAPYSQEGTYRGLGFVFLIIGPLVSWISSFVLYGLGEAIDLLQQSVDKQSTIIDALNKKLETVKEVSHEETKTLLQDIESNLPKI